VKPSAEQVRRARECVKQGQREEGWYLSTDASERLAMRCAALLAEEYARGWAACRERAANVGWLAAMDVPSADRVSEAISALEPEGEPDV